MVQPVMVQTTMLQQAAEAYLRRDFTDHFSFTQCGNWRAKVA